MEIYIVLMSGVQLFNNLKMQNMRPSYALKNNSCSVKFTGSTDAFIRSEDNKKPVPSNVKKYLYDDVKYLEDAREILDNDVFAFDTEEGVFKGTLREYFEHCKTGESEIPYYEVYHGTYKESVDSMLRNGLDYTKTGREKCGPGTYFIPSMGAAMDFGRAFLQASYIGRQKTMPRFKESFYSPVQYNEDIKDRLSEKLNVSSDVASKLLKVCAHDILVDDMGIDVLWSSSGYGSGSYFVVLNDKCMRLSRPRY